VPRREPCGETPALSGAGTADGDFVGFAGPVFSWNFPWRPADLRRFARTAQFRELQSAARNWIELQFGRVEAEAAWLAPAARLVSDYSTISATSCRRTMDIGKILAVRFGTAASVRCQRQVAVVYGFDGAMADQILDLMRVLERAGWQPCLQTRRHMVDPKPIRSIPGHDGAAIGHWTGDKQHDDTEPPQLMLIGPRESGGAPCRVHVVWTTRTHPAHTTLDPVWPPPHAARQPTASYYPLEFSGALLPADISEFAAPALERHEHAVALMIELGYYVNRETTTGPHGLPKRLMPKLW
jgi:hypothetical protein